jgi:hypothetical protein
MSQRESRFIEFEQQVRNLNTKLDDQGEARTTQANAFNADAIAITAAAGLGILLVTLGGFGAAFLGYRSIQNEAKEHIAQKVDDAIRTHGREVFEQEASKLYAEYDGKFADLYERARKIPGSG